MEWTDSYITFVHIKGKDYLQVEKIIHLQRTNGENKSTIS